MDVRVSGSKYRNTKDLCFAKRQKPDDLLELGQNVGVLEAADLIASTLAP